MLEVIRKKIKQMSDDKYKKFHSSLCPNVDGIIGVKVPILRNYAKELYKNNDLKDIKIGNIYYEELVIQGMIIGFQTNIKTKEELESIIFKQIREYVPKINSWAVCDTFCAGLKVTKKFKPEMLKLIKQYLKSEAEFEVRFAVVMLLDFYITEEYIDQVLELLETVKSDKYYIQMAVAWCYSIGLIKFYNKTLQKLVNAKIDEFTYNKSLQKAIESYRITKEQKDVLRRLKTY